MLEEHKYLQLIPFPYNLLPNLIFRMVSKSFNGIFAMAIDILGINVKCIC